MLQQKWNTTDVLTIKLLTGEEVIGTFVSSDSEEIILRKPLVPVPTGSGSVGLAPYIMSSDYLNTGSGEIPFSRSGMVTVVKTSKQFADVYVQQVSGVDLRAESKPGLIMPG